MCCGKCSLYSVVFRRFLTYLDLVTLDPTQMTLRYMKPASKHVLIQRLAKNPQVSRVVAIHLENPTYLSTFERGAKVLGLKEVVAVRYRRVEEISMLPGAAATHARRVV